jgi:hypothetical protein
MRAKQLFLIMVITVFCDFLNGQFLDPQDITGSDTLSFEINNHTLLTIDTNTIGIWQIGAPSKPIITGAYEGFRAMMTDTVNSYDTSLYSSFQVTIPHGQGGICELVFWHWYETTEGKDGGFVEVSYDMGETWSNIIGSNYPFSEYEVWDFYSQTDSIVNIGTGFSGSSGGWIKSFITWFGDIPYKSETNLLNEKDDNYFDTTLVRFVFISDSIKEELDGWAIDKIIAIYYKNWADIKYFSSGFECRLYPNPFQDIICVETNALFNSVSITDLTGRELFFSDSYLEELNLSAISPGTYWISFSLNNRLLFSSQITKASKP